VSVLWPYTAAEPLRFMLPEPPSANRWWRMGRNGRGHGSHMILSDVARAYKTAVAMLVGGAIRPITAGRQWPLFPLAQPVALEIWWYRLFAAGDVDKREGVLLDALQGTLYAKDAQVAHLVIDGEDDHELAGQVQITTWPLEGRTWRVTGTRTKRST
jgi:Holliday junction resolvase RusA-like endonuclease